MASLHWNFIGSGPELYFMTKVVKLFQETQHAYFAVEDKDYYVQKCWDKIYQRHHLLTSYIRAEGHGFKSMPDFSAFKIAYARWDGMVLQDGPISASFPFFRLFLNYNWQNNDHVQCNCWDLNRRPLMSEATALPSEPPPLPTMW